ncbi:hypothetical protein [Clostridium sp. Cult2]|uniref:hypothetical protein n=1 Tax=Clostridium sp. Cult2 TaxID=2079003 RepID=UPI001F257D43|nr:hypothetical protein [Clostridium sp. Cult2]MCF6465479.1 hypothetical protein [Clostridium sp. Cult2]
MRNNRMNGTILILGIVFIILGSTVVFSEPGSENDPLISLSYLEKRIDQLKYYIDDKLSSVEGNTNLSNDLEVVEILAGQSIIGERGTEIILRGGKAEILAGELGGLSDVTGGRDLKMGENVPANHLLIVPRDDDRGVYAITDSIYLVRGKYEIR